MDLTMKGSIPIIAIVGPTAVGKSKLALHISQLLNGQIVSADSRQIYKGMNIGTGKPTRTELSDVVHHLIDIVNPDENYSVRNYIDEATTAIQNVNSSRGIPVLAGGTGQYIWGLLEGWQIPNVAPDKQIRNHLETRLATHGLHELYLELHHREPLTAHKVDANNPRRVIRALEVSYVTQRRDIEKNPPPFHTKIIGLKLERSELYERIDKRVDHMIESGWVEEVKTLMARGYHTRLPSMSSLGYREIARHLQCGLSLREATTRIKFNTHNLARRQHNWFKEKDDRIQWFEASDSFAAPVAAINQWIRNLE